MAKLISFILGATLITAACADGHCRQITSQENPQKIKQASLSGAAANPTEDAKRILIYKDDGSLQCSKKKGMPPEEMAKQLAPAVQVFTSTKKSDGLMHLQVCGQKTGQVNVFEVLETDLAKAQQKSFKLWNLD